MTAFCTAKPAFSGASAELEGAADAPLGGANGTLEATPNGVYGLSLPHESQPALAKSTVIASASLNLPMRVICLRTLRLASR
jgi:hypothetical protein